MSMSTIEERFPSVKPRRALYTPEGAAAHLSVSRTFVYELLKSGALASVKIGHRRRITAEALDAYVASLEAA